MADVNISKYRASVVREGSKPASPGFVVSEGQSPTDPAGSGQNHLPVTIATEATGLSITDSQILSGAGTVAQYIRGDGSLADFPESSGGGSSVSYYLNGSVNQGTISGVAYKELNKVPILGAGTDFTINANGYIASFLTDAGDPNLLEIPGGNWNFETYFSASSNGGSPTFYVELYKYDGTTFTLIASNSTVPELIAFGTNITAYFTTLAVPTTTLALTDRLAVRYYVTHSGRTITMHTEGPHLCQIITTFTTGLTALNGLTAQVQNFATGTSGTDFNIASATATHTFNLPTASGTNRGALSSGDWTTFNNKENAITAGTTAQYFRGDKTFQTLNTSVVPELTNLYYTEARVNANTNVAANTAARHNAVTLGTANGLSLSTQVLSLGLASAGVTGALSGTDWSTFNAKQNALGYTPVPETRTITINGTTQDLSANRTFNVGTVTSVGLSSATSGVTIGSTPVTTSGTITLAIATASGSQNGLLSSTDWTTFNNKASTAQLANYLPLAGGTLTGALFGTTASFNSSVTAIDLIQVDSATIASLRARGGGYGGNYNTSLRSISGAVGVLQLGNNGDNYILAGNTAAGGYLIFKVNVSAESIGSGTEALRIASTGAATFTTTTTLGITIVTNDVTTLKMNSSSGSTKNWGFATTNLAASDFGIYQSNSNGGDAINAGTARLYFSGGGNVLIGTTTDNGARLQVSGTSTFSDIATFNNGTNSTNGIKVVSTLSSSLFTGGIEFIRTTVAGGSKIQPLRDAAIGGVGLNFLVTANNTAEVNATYTSSMTILNSCNVGIGTTSPSYRLTVTNSDTLTGTIAIGNDIYPGLIYSSAFTGEFRIDNRSSAGAGYITFFPNGQQNTLGNEAMRIATSRNVLIGTTSDAGYKLDVNGAIRSSDEIYINNGKYLRLQRSSGGLSIQTLGIPSGTDDVRLLTTGDFNVLNGSLTNLMTVKNGGNVGIGSTSPNRKLEIITGNGTTNGIRLTYASGVATEGMDITYLNTGNTTTSFDSLYNSDSAIMQFRMKAAGTAVTAMTIFGNANVLIGSTTDNGSKLQVNGAIRTAQPVGTTSNGWLLGRALVSGTSTPDRWIRVQIGLEYYDILAVYMGTL